MLSESFAQYLSITYLEDKYGPYNNVFTPSPLFKYVVYNFLYGNFGVSLPTNHRQDLVETPYRSSLLDGLDEPIEAELKSLKFSEDNATKWYLKGYLVTRAIENIIGKDAFDSIIANLYETSNGLAITSDEILQKIKIQTGKNLKTFAADWIYGAKSLDYSITEVKVKKTKNNFSTFVSVKNNGTGSMPGDLLIFSSKNKVLGHQRITVAPGKLAAFEFNTELPPLRASIDEREFTLDYDRKNNFFPRKGFSVGFIFDSSTNDQHYLTFDIYLAMIQAIELRGGFLDTYKWSLLGGREPYTSDIAFYLGKTALTFDIGRNKYIYSSLSYRALTDNASKNYYNFSIGTTFPIFTPLETGYTGRTTYPSNVLSLGVSYSDYSNILNTTHDDFENSNLLKTQTSFDLTYRRDDILKLAWTNTLSAKFYLPNNQFKLTLLSQKYFKPMGRMLLATSLKLGTSTQNLLRINKFNLDNLNIYNYKVRDQALIDANIEAMFKLAKSKKARVLGVAEKHLPILNFWVFEGINGGVYIRAADVFNPSNIGDTFKFHIVTGPKVQFLQSSFLGMPIDMTVAVAYPLYSYENSATSIFLDASMRF